MRIFNPQKIIIKGMSDTRKYLLIGTGILAAGAALYLLSKDP
jgi:hypothetical protein